MLASALSMPAIQLTEEETKKLAQAIQNVSQYYSVALDPKMQAWGALIMTAGSIYGTRFAAYFLAEQKTEQPPATVHQLRPNI